MNAICGDNRFEIIAKVKEHLLKATNIEMQPEELKQVDNILFRLWQLGYFDSVEKISKLEEQIEDWKSDHEYSLRLMKGLNEKIAELETKISILLSCKNCPENKGGLLCQKEYEGKCLAQKIQYIKELQEENAELKDKLNNLSKVAEVRLANWQKYEEENEELRAKIEKMKLCQNCKFEDNDCIEEPCSVCTRCLGNLKRKGNSDKWEIEEE